MRINWKVIGKLGKVKADLMVVVASLKCEANDINVGKRTEGRKKGRKPTRCHLNIQRKWISILICGLGVVSQL